MPAIKTDEYSASNCKMVVEQFMEDGLSVATYYVGTHRVNKDTFDTAIELEKLHYIQQAENRQ